MVSGKSTTSAKVNIFLIIWLYAELVLYSSCRSQGAREKSMQCRSETDKCINGVATSVWNGWNNSNDSFQSRIFEMTEAKTKLQNHLQKILQEIFSIERHIGLLKKSIQDKSDPLKVAQSRVEARNHRMGIELCR